MSLHHRFGRVSLFCMLTLCVVPFAYGQLPFVTTVFEYRPAPGQFVNEAPAYSPGDDEETMRRKAEEALAGNAGGIVTLGGWGGYIVLGFDHMIVNQPDQYDFRILGNAVYSDERHPEQGGTSEPGTVWVSYDANANGLPDDEWYELAGSEDMRARTNYQLTWFRTPEDHVRTPFPAEDLVDTTYIFWRDADAVTGYMAQNRYHLQNYWPLWNDADRIVCTGTLLPPNAVSYEDGGMRKFILYNYAYGYADNHPDYTDGACMDIGWAVTSDRRSITLPGIHFLKIMTGVHQQCGWIGELSTEVSGAVDLHPAALPTTLPISSDASAPAVRKVWRDGRLFILRDGRTYSLLGLEETNN